VLHDTHAEVVALRGFNRWVLTELEHILQDFSYQSPYLQRALHPPSDHQSSNSLQIFLFAFKGDVSFHFFTTEAPCGDASMELLMRLKDPEDALPWVDTSSNPAETPSPLLQGRGYFSQLGAVRRKPARGDAEATMSKSCTDKLAMKQFTSLLSFPADLFIESKPNAFIKSFIVYQDQYDAVGYERAFGTSGRLVSVAENAHTFDVLRLSAPFPRFPFDKRSQAGSPKASNVSCVWVRGASESSQHLIEVLLNGVKQGYKQFEERTGKQSAICRRQMWHLGQRVCSLALVDKELSCGDVAVGPVLKEIQGSLGTDTYKTAKSHSLRLTRQQLKEKATRILGGWATNTGDDDWSANGG
jgi:tRNA-specific adenosine deaminase 1